MKAESKSLHFKTTINCGGCVTAVTPHLDNAEGVCEWEVDTTNKDKILTVKTDDLTVEQVIDIVNKAGFKAELLSI